MVTFDSRTSYDKAVSAEGAKLRGSDWKKTVSYITNMTNVMTSSNHLELLMYLSAKLLQLQAAM